MPKNRQYIYWYNFINAKNRCLMCILKVKYTEFTLQQFCLPNGLRAIRPGSTMARAPVFSHNKGYLVGFMKLLFRRMFIHAP